MWTDLKKKKKTKGYDIVKWKSLLWLVVVIIIRTLHLTATCVCYVYFVHNKARSFPHTWCTLKTLISVQRPRFIPKLTIIFLAVCYFVL